MVFQLYMWSASRERILRRHNFYFEQVRKRVLSQFANIEGEAERYTDAQYHLIGSLPARDNIDMSDVADMANNRGQEFYGLLYDLKEQMFLAALAGLYHQWDKDLRDFIESELRHDLNAKTAIEVAWDPNLGNIFDVLEQFGWKCRATAFFTLIDACRFIVNVHKHGKGRSLDEVARKYPQYLPHPPAPFGSAFVISRIMNGCRYQDRSLRKSRPQCANSG